MDAALAVVAALSVVALFWCTGRNAWARWAASRTEPESVASGSDPPAPPIPEPGDRAAGALDALDVGVVVSGPEGEMLFSNRAADAILSSHDRRSLVADTMGEVTAAARSGVSRRREIDIFGPPAESYAVSAGPLAGGGVGEVVAVIENVSERHRLDQVRRDFVANISHELKTPVGAVGLLADTLADETDLDIVARLSGRLSQEVARLSATIDDLLQLSSIEFGDDADLEDVTVASIVDDAVARLRTAAEARGVLLEVETGATIRVHGDRRQLVSALYNLVDNAVKFSRDGDSVTVRVVEDDHQRVRIEVQDQGIGIPARDLDRIFERFYRVDRARARGTGGTGLGLAIVRHVAQNHGGVASVTSREGRGSTFTLSLPAVDG